MKIRHVSVEISPARTPFFDIEMECRVDVVADVHRFSIVEVLLVDDFHSCFSRLIDQCKRKILAAVEEHENNSEAG